MAEGDIALNDGEKILWQGKPGVSVLGVWFFTKGVGATLVAAFLTVWCWGFFGAMVARATNHSFGPFSAVQMLKAVVLLSTLSALGTLGYVVVLRQTYQYFITNQRIVFIGGLLMKKRRSVHYHKVTDVEVSQNFLEQLLVIRSLKIFTAGASRMSVGGWERAEITFQGLKEVDTAEQIINNTLKSYRATGE